MLVCRICATSGDWTMSVLAPPVVSASPVSVVEVPVLDSDAQGKEWEFLAAWATELRYSLDH